MTPPSHVKVPPREVIPKTAPDDPIDYYFKPFTRRLYRARLELAAKLLGFGPYNALLEVGYGSGVFLPELAKRSNRLVGVDIHNELERVNGMLATLGLTADLHHASLFDLPFADAEFDGLVCLSVLEHLEELEPALSECARVLTRAGVAVFGFPVRNVVTDTFFRAVGYAPREIHPSGHRQVLRAVQESSDWLLEKAAHFPRFTPRDVSAYVVCRCRRA